MKLEGEKRLGSACVSKIEKQKFWHARKGTHETIPVKAFCRFSLPDPQTDGLSLLTAPQLPLHQLSLHYLTFDLFLVPWQPREHDLAGLPARVAVICRCLPDI